MHFHKTFSKKDIINICETLDIEIEDMKDFNKSQIINNLEKWCDDNPTRNFLPNILFLDTVPQLIQYLSTINQSKINSAKTRTMVMQKAKKMIAYGKNGYLFTQIGYPSIEELLEDIEIILPFGDSPSVRKAINWINNDPKINEKYFAVVSEATKMKLETRRKLKNQSHGKAIVKQGHFTISFD